MSASYNKLTLVGNITADPVLKSTKQGTSTCTFTIATDRRRREPDGSVKTDFFDVRIWRETAENFCRYMKKGSKVLAAGELHKYEYTKKDGTKGNGVIVEADEIRYLSSRDQTSAAPSTTPPTPSAPSSYTPVETDDLPF